MRIRGGRSLGSVADKDIVLRFQDGDDQAFEEIFRRHHARVRHTCARFLVDRQDADEAVQETFLKAYQALPRFNGRYMLGAWLTKIANNVCLDMVRSRSRSGRVIVLPSDEPEVIAEGAEPESDRIGDHLNLTETFKEIQPLHARALLLRAHQGLSHQEMADRLEMTPQQVKALLHRARRSFRKAWDGAESLALSPILLLKHHLGNRGHAVKQASATQAPSVAVTAPSLMPFVEKVAATAVVVAVALSGLPSTSRQAPRSTPRSETVERTGVTAGSGPGRIARSSRAERTATLVADTETPVLRKDKAEIAEIEDVLPDPPASPAPEPPQDPHKNPPLVGPTASQASKLHRKVQRQLKELFP